MLSIHRRLCLTAAERSLSPCGEFAASAAGTGGRGVSPPGARYFSHAGKVPKSALRGPALADFSPPLGGTVLMRLPPKNPGDAALLR